MSELRSSVFLKAMKDDIASILLYHLVSVKDIKFKPGSIAIQSSESESNVIDSSRPVNVTPGAVEDDTSILKIKSLAPLSAGLGGSLTTSGVSEEDTSIVVIVWSWIRQQREPFTVESSAVTNG